MPVVRAYQLGFIVLFGLLVVLALVIMLGFARIPDGQMTESANVTGPDTAVELANLLNEDSIDDFELASDSEEE